MMPAYRNFRALVQALPTLSRGGLRSNRAASPMLALVLVLSVALASVTAHRFVRTAGASASSAEDAALRYSMLRQNLPADGAAQVRETDRPAAATIELVAWLSVVLLSAAVLLRGTTSQQTADWPVAATIEAPGDRYDPLQAGGSPPVSALHEGVERLARQRLSASVAAARVSKRNNERQIALSRGWHEPRLTIVPATQPVEGMEVYDEERADAGPPDTDRPFLMAL